VISVALCTHDGAAFVDEQVRSILGQTLPPDEIVLGDDASTDDTVAIVERAVADHRRAGGVVDLIVRRRDPALGVVANFADALAHTHGGLIALSDQDDIWLPRKLETISAAFDAEPELLLVHTDARLVDAHGEPTGSTLLQALEITSHERHELERGDAFDALLRRNLVTGATVVLRRELLESATPFPPGWVHDEWLAVIAAATGTVRLVPEALIDYRQHGGNQIGARRPSAAERMAKLREPREPRATGLVERSSALVAALERREADVPRAHLDGARARLAHDRVRRSLPGFRPARLPRILAAAARGDYARYSRGGMDMLRDLVQPVSPEPAATLER